ncbi:unnamed protein product, partial [Closterium sp. Naga37s-1]
MPFLPHYPIALRGTPPSAWLALVESTQAHVKHLRFLAHALSPALSDHPRRTALSAWLSSSTAPPDGQASQSSRLHSAYNEDGSPAVSVSWEEWQRAYEQARGAESRQQHGHAKGVGVGSSRGEQSKGRVSGNGRGEGWQRAHEHEQEHVKGVQGGQQEMRGQGTEKCSGGRDGWWWVQGVAARHGEGGGSDGEAQTGAVVQAGRKGRGVGDMQMQMQGQGPGQGEGHGVVVCEGGWEWLHRPSAPPVWEMTGAEAGAEAGAVAQPEARSAGSGYHEARAGVGVEGGAERWRTGLGTGGGVVGAERRRGEGDGDVAVTREGGGVGDGGDGRRGGGRGVVGAVRECVSLDWVPERLLVKFQQSLGLYRLGFNFQFRHSHHDLPAIPSAIAPPVSPSSPSVPLHTLTSARSLRQSRPLISVGPYQAYPADIKVVIKPSPTSKAASKHPAPTTASPAARLASMVTRVARAAVGGGKVQVMPVAGTVQVASGRVGLLGLADARLHLSHHWPSSTSHLRLLLHSPFSAAHTCACRWSSTRLTRPHRNGSSIRDREVQTGASRGAGSAGGGDMRASHVNTSNGLAVDGGGNGRGGVCESTDSSPGEVGLWSAGRGEVEQQGGGAAGSGGGGVVQVARAKACVPMWHGMDVRLTSSMRYSMPWCIG